MGIAHTAGTYPFIIKGPFHIWDKLWRHLDVKSVDSWFNKQQYKEGPRDSLGSPMRLQSSNESHLNSCRGLALPGCWPAEQRYQQQHALWYVDFSSSPKTLQRADLHEPLHPLVEICDPAEFRNIKEELGEGIVAPPRSFIRGLVGLGRLLAEIPLSPLA